MVAKEAQIAVFPLDAIPIFGDHSLAAKVAAKTEGWCPNLGTPFGEAFRRLALAASVDVAALTSEIVRTL